MSESSIGPRLAARVSFCFRILRAQEARPHRSRDVALIVSDPPASAAAVFTQNLVQAPPVVLSREHVRASADAMRAVIVNSGNANCSVGPGGMVALARDRRSVSPIARLPRESSRGVLDRGDRRAVARRTHPERRAGTGRLARIFRARIRWTHARDHDHRHAAETGRRKLAASAERPSASPVAPRAPG
jgi:hypothetical protein